MLYACETWILVNDAERNVKDYVNKMQCKIRKSAAKKKSTARSDTERITTNVDIGVMSDSRKIKSSIFWYSGRKEQDRTAAETGLSTL